MNNTTIDKTPYALFHGGEFAGVFCGLSEIAEECLNHDGGRFRFEKGEDRCDITWSLFWEKPVANCKPRLIHEFTETDADDETAQKKCLEVFVRERGGRHTLVQQWMNENYRFESIGELEDSVAEQLKSGEEVEPELLDLIKAMKESAE